MQETLPAIVIELTPLLFKMDSIIIETTDSVGFITSDNPCVWIDPEAYKRPPAFQNPALMYESTEIRFPISPRQMIVFTRNIKYERSYSVIGNSFLDDANRVTRFQSHEFFIVNSNTKKDYWFIRKTNPANS